MWEITGDDRVQKCLMRAGKTNLTRYLGSHDRSRTIKDELWLVRSDTIEISATKWYTWK